MSTRRVTHRRPITVIDTDTGKRTRRQDHLAGEEPLQLIANGQPLTVTMRTPGHDIELVHGFLLGEGVIDSRTDVTTARYCAGSTINEDGVGTNTYNVLEIDLEPAAAMRAASAVRSFTTTSSCGVCGSESIDEIERSSRHPIERDTPTVPAGVLATLPERLREQQRVFAKTGGLHGAGLYDVTTDEMLVREDVGRHNATDKALGAALLADLLPLSSHVLVLSGRVSFELVQKAAMAGIGVVAAVSAPSSLSIDLADRLGITVAAFIRANRLNLYTHPERIG